MGNLIVILIIFSIVGLAFAKLRRDKKNGVKCSGCSHSQNCPTRGIHH